MGETRTKMGRKRWGKGGWVSGVGLLLRLRYLGLWKGRSMTAHS